MSPQIEITNSPAIPGIRFRGFEGELDFPKMIPIIEACNKADNDDEVAILEDLKNNYAHLNNCDPYKDMLFVEIEGEAIAYSRVFWFEDARTKELIYLNFYNLAPDWRDKGIEEAILTWDETRIRQIAQSHAQDVPHLFETFCKDEQTTKVNLYESNGYKPVRYSFLMKRPLDDIPAAELPEGIEVRPLSPDQYRQAWDASNEAFRDHWGFTEQTEKDYQAQLEWRLFDPKIWQVGWDGDEIVGMVQNFFDPLENEKFGRKRGWTEGISVRRPWRKKGVAKALIVRSMQMFKDMGMDEVALGVDALNPHGALDLYQGLGYVQYRKFMIYRKPVFPDKA
ncbi:MAG: GNAT family N-acetyltransferase [Anaerolineaceae bacterium]|nr:GNAT family N-acetyltransferase [Anaerolineaceae bacterium]